MVNTEANNGAQQKLVGNGDLSLVGFNPRPKPTNSRKRIEGKIREHVVKGRRYYSYCRGTDREIYLGSAETILKVVKGEWGAQQLY